MLYGPNGQTIAVKSSYSRPERQLDAEQSVREQLKSIDTLLDVRWFPHAIFNDSQKSFEGRYALVCQWPQGDKRWELYQNGEIEDPVDMLGWFCTDIHDATSMPVSVDSIEQKIVELLGKCDGTRIPHATRMREILERNAKLRKAKQSEFTDKAEDIAGTLWNLAGKVGNHKLESIMQEISERGIE